jgi:hypothetical protein
MRTNNIEIHFKLPININKPDDNGVIYTEEAIKNACEKASNKPIIAYNEKGNRVVIGVANNIQYKDGVILVDGYTFAGGTTETVAFNDNKYVESMEILSFGLAGNCNEQYNGKEIKWKLD